MEYLLFIGLLVLIFAVLIWLTWGTAQQHYALKWDREIGPGLEAKGWNRGHIDGCKDGERIGERLGYRRGYSAGRAAMVRHYAEQQMDATAQRIVAQIMNRN